MHGTILPSTYVFGHGKPSDNSWAQGVLRCIISHESFVPDRAVGGVLGTHGVWKGASTYIAKKGISREYVELRGRWAMRTGVVDKYVDIDLPAPDAKAAFALTGRNGPCRYVVKEEAATTIDESFLLTCIVPNIARAFGNPIALLLARALFFAIFECPACVPSSIVERVTMEMGRCNISMSVNPIRRVSFVVVQEDDQCILHDLSTEMNGAVSNASNMCNHAVAGSMDAVLTMLALMRRQDQEQHADMRCHLNSRLDGLARDIATIKRQVQEAATIPAFRLGSLPGRQGNDGQVAKLIDRPKSLKVVWREYVTGVNGTKAAREYNNADRAKNSTKYSRRKNLWDIVSQWVRAGKTPEQAISKIYQVYHPVVSVSRILDGLAKAKPTGGHPELNI